MFEFPKKTNTKSYSVAGRHRSATTNGYGDTTSQSKKKH